MKKITRTTIKIRKRELVIVKSAEKSAEIIRNCPACNFPVVIGENSDTETKTIDKLSAKSEV